MLTEGDSAYERDTTHVSSLAPQCMHCALSSELEAQQGSQTACQHSSASENFGRHSMFTECAQRDV